MSIPTTRTKEDAVISINVEICTGCGLCVKACCSDMLKIENGKAAELLGRSVFNCIACGHCMAICPEGAIEIHGRTMSPEDVFTLPKDASDATYEQLMTLYERRRSVRKFNQKTVEADVIEKILAASRTAPMGLPPSDVHVLVLNGREKVTAFTKDFAQLLKSMKYLVSGWFLAIMRPFWGKATDEMFRSFMRPLFENYIGEMEKGNNYITYDAPLAMYFYGSPYTDPADPIVAATYAMHAGEALGLGTCMLGAIHPFIQRGKKAAQFRKAHGIKYKSQEGLFVIFGYHDLKYKKGVKRTFADETFA